ncbi:MAG: F0F1 ATP synthase subunit gamma [Rhodospirillaceae bacterium]|nr:F0F1 ATP synthase subunit gamma [Alphaproteobacteria bacterium]MBR71619.1 F0F1 ATP synthase subunit gamma [Rhodospirillaceae bacterium]
MASLKSLRLRINSVKQTQKITSAMKLVAASKLRRAQEAAEAARPYAERMERMLGSLALAMAGREDAPRLLSGTGNDKSHLIVVCTADRGLCGGFNSSIVRGVRLKIQELQNSGKNVKIYTVGRKGREQLRREFGELIIEHKQGIGRRGPEYSEASEIGEQLTSMFENEQFDVCTIVYNRFHSVMSQVVTFQQLIPFTLEENRNQAEENVDQKELESAYDFEPDETVILEDILPRNLGVQVFRALLENAASEQGARMSAMDNATRNAGEMIEKVTLEYNRSRQAQITKELIEIVSGAEAL